MSYIPQEKSITRATKFCLTEREAVGWYTYMNVSKVTVMVTEKKRIGYKLDWKQKKLRALFKHFRQKMVVMLTGILSVSVVDIKDFGFYYFVCLFLWKLMDVNMC